jgi:NDP-sugar pyrophosphorylase family protein
MKAMILAAGKGTRVQPLAYDVPKPMIPLIRKPVLALIEGPTVIGPGSVIESGAEIRECLVDYDTEITSVARLDRLIISHGHCIKPDGTFFSHRQADLGWLIDDARHLKRLSEDHNLLIQPARQADTEARRSP